MYTLRRALKSSFGHLERQECRRLLSQESDKGVHYIDSWFSSIVKPSSFYDHHADDAPRRYFYNIDLQGRLFLEDTLPKNVATSIKSTKFLDFFFRRLRPISPKEKERMEMEWEISPHEYPFISPCGKEMNFVRPAATPIVFHSFQPNKQQLVYGGTMTQPFHPSNLAISQSTGRLYHLLETQFGSKGVLQHTLTHGLIRSAVLVSLADQLQPVPPEEIFESPPHRYSGMAMITEDTVSPIPFLPSKSEPGCWAMPHDEESE